MKKKLLVLLIAVIPSLMPNLASAIAIDVGECFCARCGILWCAELGISGIAD
jgi:hypothetical protein